MPVISVSIPPRIYLEIVKEVRKDENDSPGKAAGRLILKGLEYKEKLEQGIMAETALETAIADSKEGGDAR